MFLLALNVIKNEPQERKFFSVLLTVYPEWAFISYKPTHPDYLGVSQIQSWGHTFGHVKPFCVCRVYMRGWSFKNFEHDTMKLSVNKEKLTGLSLCYYSTGFDFKICFWVWKVSRTFEKQAPNRLLCKTGHQILQIKSTFEVFCAWAWNFAPFLRIWLFYS